MRMSESKPATQIIFQKIHKRKTNTNIIEILTKDFIYSSHIFSCNYFLVSVCAWLNIKSYQSSFKIFLMRNVVYCNWFIETCYFSRKWKAPCKESIRRIYTASVCTETWHNHLIPITIICGKKTKGRYTLKHSSKHMIANISTQGACIESWRGAAVEEFDLEKEEWMNSMQSSTAAVLWESTEDPADFDLVKEDEPRCKNLFGEIKRRAFVTLSARSFTSSMGEVSDCQGILNMQLFTCPFLVDFLLEFCLKDKPGFSFM